MIFWDFWGIFSDFLVISDDFLEFGVILGENPGTAKSTCSLKVIVGICRWLVFGGCF